MQQWSVPAWLVVVVLAVGLVVLLVLGVLTVALFRRLADVERQLAETRDSQGQNPGLEGSEPGVRREAAGEYVITQVGGPDREPAPTAPTVPAPLFADLVLRESVVKAASYVAGVRRALSAESRNRIRFEMRREVKRARKQRRAGLKQAKREWEARQREHIDLEPESAA